MMAKEGLIFVAIGLVVTAGLLWSANRWDSRALFVFSLLTVVLTLFVVFFFRDPDRVVLERPDIIVSPADGKIIAIEEIANHPFVGDSVIKISIFLSVFDVHINRVPVSGVVEYVDYNPGKFFAAFLDKASELNERTDIGIITESGQKIACRQIAGLIARRIVCRLGPGDHVVAGDRFGMIRFGSRTEMFLPLDTRIDVKLGDHVSGGSSVIGYLGGVTKTLDTAAAARRNNGD